MAASPALVWFRRDLRVTDHPALHAAAAETGGNVIPLYVVSTWRQQHRWTGEPRQRFLSGSLHSLARNLETLGARLIVRHGRAAEVIERVLLESGAQSIFFHVDPDPFGVATEERVSTLARARGVAVHALRGGVGIHERDLLRTGAGKPYRVHSPFARSWVKLPLSEPLRRPTRLSTPTGLASEGPPDLAHWGLTQNPAVEIPEPGERAARLRLTRFLAGPIASYAAKRNLPAGTTTSRLGPDLRFGLLSAREVVHEARRTWNSLDAAGRKGADTFVGEIIWRDFYLQLLWHFPEVLEHEFNADYRGLPWQENNEGFARWCAGETGFPFVDAGMRQLNATGFMHNRVRMVVSMFLTKDLHLDWRLGERYFMQRLVDGEIASNNGGWQWSAGCGADAAPYFRIQNPWTQGANYDADGSYIKEWIPELRDVPAARLHQPATPGLRLARDYPLPMLDHAREREETLRIFKEQLGSAAERNAKKN